MLSVGLTGGIGSGKTIVAEVFEHLGIPVYNADQKAKELMNDSPLKDAIIDKFGEDIFSNGKLNRGHLGKIVFNNPTELEKLNALVHPAVREDFLQWKDIQEAPYVIREAAILFESGSNKDCDKVITVSAPEDLRIIRVMKRDDVSRKEVIARINNQWPDEKKVELSDYVIVNDEAGLILPQILKIHQEMISLIN